LNVCIQRFRDAIIREAYLIWTTVRDVRRECVRKICKVKKLGLFREQ
jgi:hypothetical protein